MSKSKYITVVINSDNNVYLPYYTPGKAPLFEGGKTFEISNKPLLDSVKFGAFDITDIKNPFDFGYIFGYILLDEVKASISSNTMFNINKMLITKIVPSWNSGNILNGKSIYKRIKDIDYNALCREVAIDSILE